MSWRWADGCSEKRKEPMSIVLSLLKERGLLAVPRRGMYAFPRPKNFLSEAKSIWQTLEGNKSENLNE